MKTYVVSFYPGMVLPKPYYITVERNKTDYQAVLDALADKLTEEGADGLFDDANEKNDDEVVVCGNNSRRLITGGMLTIQQIEKKNVAMILNDNINSRERVSGTVDIGFINNEDEEDETEFDVNDLEELAECWMDFCIENDLDVTKVTCVTILGWKEVSFPVFAKEEGRIDFKIPFNSNLTKEELEEMAKEQEAMGNAVLFKREIKIGERI